MLLLWAVLPMVGFGQVRSSSDSVLVSTAPDTLNVTRYGFSGWTYGDKGRSVSNSLDATHDFFPLYGSSQLRNDLGNMGSAQQVVLFDMARSFGFNFRPGREGYWRNVAKRELLLSDGMFSNVHYVVGANKENYLKANLTRGFGELLDMGFSFNRINSEGIYLGQQNLLTDMVVYGAFRSNDDRYRAAMMFNYTDLNTEENGGLLIDSVFEQNLTAGRNFIPVNLAFASNRWKGFEVGLEQRFFLLKEDSTRAPRVYRPAVSHSFSVSRSSMIYADVPDTTIGFYENIYFDSVATYDSTNLLGVTNSVRFELVRSDSIGSKWLDGFTVGALHQYYRVASDSLVTKINNVGIGATARGVLFGGFGWWTNGNFMVLGYNILDAKLDLGLEKRIGRSRFEGTLTYSRFRPDLITDNYRSNNFVWDNSWTQTNHLRAGVSYRQSRLRFRASLTYHVLDKLVVFGTDRLPFQSAAVNQVLVLRMKEHFKLRWFNIVLDGALQTVLSGNDIRIPTALGRGLIYYQNDLFKKKLRLQIGVEASYSTSYFANAYNPALSAFYIQNEKQVGNYPFIDVFVNFRIKKFKAFFKVEHVNAGLMGYTYYLTPGYPANDLAWKFGLNWAFLD